MSRLAIFDLDHTLLAGDSDHLWGAFLVEQGLVDGEVYARENDRFYAEYQAGTLDIHAYAAFAFEPLVRLGQERLEPLRRQFVEQQIQPIVAAGAPALLDRHRAEGDTVVITTATNAFVTQPIAELLGVEHLIATDPEQNETGFTGRIAGTPNFRDGKVVRLRAWIAEHGHQNRATICYSDSANDLPLLEMADQAVATHPDPRLRAIAQERGWPILDLSQAPASAQEH